MAKYTFGRDFEDRFLTDLVLKSRVKLLNLLPLNFLEFSLVPSDQLTLTDG